MSSHLHRWLTVFQAHIRMFLTAENVRLSGTKLPETLPACATQQDVDSFLNDQSRRPSKECIIMAWFEPLTSHWNQECIALLAAKAQSTLQADIAAGDMSKVDDAWISLEYLCSQIHQSLKKMRVIMASCTVSPSPPSAPPSSSTSIVDKEKHVKAKSCRRGRRITVIFTFHYS